MRDVHAILETSRRTLEEQDLREIETKHRAVLDALGDVAEI